MIREEKDVRDAETQAGGSEQRLPVHDMYQLLFAYRRDRESGYSLLWQVAVLCACEQDDGGTEDVVKVDSASLPILPQAHLMHGQKQAYGWSNHGHCRQGEYNRISNIKTAKYRKASLRLWEYFL